MLPKGPRGYTLMIGGIDDPSFDDPSFVDPNFDDPNFDDPNFVLE